MGKRGSSWVWRVAGEGAGPSPHTWRACRGGAPVCGQSLIRELSCGPTCPGLNASGLCWQHSYVRVVPLRLDSQSGLNRKKTQGFEGAGEEACVFIYVLKNSPGDSGTSSVLRTLVYPWAEPKGQQLNSGSYLWVTRRTKLNIPRPGNSE